jgi:hypothetical protein
MTEIKSRQMHQVLDAHQIIRARLRYAVTKFEFAII